MQTSCVRRLYILGLAAYALALPLSSIYAKDLKKNGSIKVIGALKKDYPSLTKITMQDAISAATRKVPGKVIKAELETEDGYLVYEVRVASKDNKAIQVYVDAGNASVLGTDTQSMDLV